MVITGLKVGGRKLPEEYYYRLVFVQGWFLSEIPSLSERSWRQREVGVKVVENASNSAKRVGIERLRSFRRKSF